jgi:hypothetical protein
MDTLFSKGLESLVDGTLIRDPRQRYQRRPALLQWQEQTSNTVSQRGSVEITALQRSSLMRFGEFLNKRVKDIFFEEQSLLSLSQV